MEKVNYWEPREFKVGDEVVIHLRGECNFSCPECGVSWHKHVPAGKVAGRVEVVSNVSEWGCWWNASPEDGCGKSSRKEHGHKYGVAWADSEGAFGWFAAIELEPMANTEKGQNVFSLSPLLPVDVAV